MFVTREHLLNAMSLADPLAHYLVVLEGTTPGKRLEIGAQPITIGRGLQTLVCDDKEVSRLHARVALVNGAVMAEDLSTNGTFVDGSALPAR
jgi:pSer/pThr/pTyr-binding forkhead associated (FHA) protein